MTREEFEKTFCFGCGSQRCYGFGSETAMGCQHYKILILGEPEDTVTVPQEALEEFITRARHLLKKHNL